MSFISDIQSDNFIWDVIAEHLPNNRKKGVGKFDVNINCPMCVTRGERRPDRFHRCGLKRNPYGLGINCFNCHFKTRWSVGELLSRPLSSFMEELGVDDMEVKRLAHRALVVQRALGDQRPEHENGKDDFEPKFTTAILPVGAKPIVDLVQEGCRDARFLQAMAYLATRGIEIATGHPYLWSPSGSMAKRIIIPMYFKGKIVGWTARDTTDTLERKYHADTPPDLLFNADLLNSPYRRFLPIVEGPFDAIGISGIATLGAKLSDNQIRWINSSDKVPVMVVDRDRGGLHSIDVARKNKWHVSFPRLASQGWWDENVKDAAKATELYGRLYTVRSILATMTNDPYKIDVWSKLLI